MNSFDQPTLLTHIATLTGGSLTEGKAWHSDKVDLPYQGSKITADYYTLWSGKYSQIFTRIVSEVKAVENFALSICSQNLFSKIEKLFGGQDVETGKSDFDKAFMIKSNNEFKVKTLLQNANLQKMLLKQKNLNLDLSKSNGIWISKLNTGISELSIYVEEEIKEVDKLKDLLDLFQLIMSELKARNIIME